MGLINVTTPSDGETIDAADVSTPINTIVNEINGSLDNANIATGAAISGTKIADASVSASKLSFINYQTDNNNSISSTNGGQVTMQMGWGQVTGNDTTNFETSVTLPTAFTTLLGVSVSLLPVKAGTAATDITDLGADYSSIMASISVAAPITTSGFNVVFMRAGNVFASTTYYGFSWIAWGII